MSGRAPDIDIFVPIRDEATVRMRYREDNREWLHVAVETRRPKWSPGEKVWHIPNSAAQRVFDRATADGRNARLTRRFKPDTEQCTVQCQTAAPETVFSCVCVCGGKGHGRASGGWQQVGRRLLVRSVRGEMEQTISNGLQDGKPIPEKDRGKRRIRERLRELRHGRRL
jgi:hypothetical protein